MNELERPPTPDNPSQTPQLPADRPPGQAASEAKSRTGRLVFLITVLVLLLGALGIGSWKHYALAAEAMATAEQYRDFVPNVRTAPVRASGSTMSVIWPATTEAFEQANIYARASGYISQRNVDIGSHVKAGDLLVQVIAPELDHQIAQAEGILAQMQATLDQAIANRDLARVTWDRDNPLVQKGWVTAQQGDTDRLTLQARDAAISVAQANIVAQKAQLQVLNQQKAYQSVVAPFDGVITQRNIDIGSLVQADATSGTFLFNLVHRGTLRIQLYVPQDQAFGVAPGLDAMIRVPEMPDRQFPGSVTRIANALQPGSRTLVTEIDVPNPDYILSPGVYCTVELKIPRKKPSLIVPAEAIVVDRDGLNVLVVENSVAEIHHVNVVRDLGDAVEVSAGVKAADQVILNPPVDLTDGHKVKISNDHPEVVGIGAPGGWP
jgi:RND family efflux transporter MFP subunit